MKLAIVILNYNNSRDTIECMESVRRLHKLNRAEVLVVDNGSDKADVAELNGWFLQQKEPAISQMHRVLQNETAVALESENSNRAVNHELQISFELLELPRNLGYGAGNNRGIDHLWCRDWTHLWVLNNDLVLSPESYVELVDRSAELGDIAGFRLTFYDDEYGLQADGGEYNAWLGTTRHCREFEAVTCPEPEHQPDYEIGASLLFSRRALERLGGFVEDHFLFYEEIDLAYRIQALNLEVSHLTKPDIYHKEGATVNPGSEKSPIADYFGMINRVRVSWRYDRLRVPTVFMGVLLALAKRLVRRRFDLVVSVLSLSFSRKLITPLRKSHAILSGKPSREALSQAYLELKSKK